MNRTPYYSEEISQTALALLALVAAGKSLDKATVQALRSLLLQDDSKENRVSFTIFSDQDDEDGNTELPVIIPFVSRVNHVNHYHNGYGTLSFRNKFPSTHSVSVRKEINSHLRIFSPDSADYRDDGEEEYCVAANAPTLRLYAE